MLQRQVMQPASWSDGDPDKIPGRFAQVEHRLLYFGPFTRRLRSLRCLNVALDSDTRYETGQLLQGELLHFEHFLRFCK